MKTSGISLRAMADESTEAVVDIIGVIGWEVGFEQLRGILAALPDTIERIVFDIYSPGGDVWDGNAIIHEIGNLKQTTVARVRVAASMATLIAVACDEREMSNNGRWLIHNPWTMAMGDAAEMEKRAKELREAELEAAEFYALRTDHTTEAMIDLMAEERWIRAPEAKEFGFVQTVLDPFAVADYSAARKEIAAEGKWPQALADFGEIDADEEKTTEDESHVPETTTGAEGDQEPAEGDTTDPADGEGDATGAEGEGDPEPSGASALVAAAVAAALTVAEAEHATLAAALKVTNVKQAKLLSERQSEIDRLKNQLKVDNDAHEQTLADSQAALEGATERLHKLTLGSLAFIPGIETWADAYAKCGNNYEETRRQYPELFTQYRESQKTNRK